MVLKLTLNGRTKKIAAIGVTLVTCLLLTVAGLFNFIIGALTDQRVTLSTDASTASFILAPLTDERIGVNPKVLKSTARYFPNSSRLQARLAQAEMMEDELGLFAAEFHALRAISLSPYDYSLRLLLASVEEDKGDSRAVEKSLRAAVRLAPNDIETRRRLANLLLNDGRLDESLDEYRRAFASDSQFLHEALELIWKATSGNLDALETVTGSNPTARFTLAQFLLEQSRASEAAIVFSNIDRGARLNSGESSRFLKALFAAGHLELSRNLSAELVGGSNPEVRERPPIVGNGGFESAILANLTPFDWKIRASTYARIGIDTHKARTGARSLRIVFAGGDTTRLDDEITQVIVVHPGARYRLECYAKSENLVTTEGPRVVITSETSPAWIGASDPVAAGTNDWRLLEIDFVAPKSASGDSAALRLSIKREPRFSYDAPTRGSVWFDDFTITEIERPR